MASKSLTPTPTTTHFPQPNDMPSMTPPSLTQVRFPKKKENLLITSTSTNKKLFSSTSALQEPASSITKPEKTNDLSSVNLAEMWREVQGCNNWDNLVDPLHPLLRQEIVRYGELVVACYKAFDLDPNSRRYLCCKYGKRSMFKQIGMESSGYEVTKYIYATTDITIPILSQNTPSCSRWIGYVAVSGDDMARKIGRRDILITFRGTVTNHEWMANFMSSLTPARLDPHNSRPGVMVESGFLSLYTSEDGSVNKFGLGSCREQLLSEVARLVNKYKGEEVSISLAGHSMGSSLAQLLAYDIAELGLNGEITVTVFSFGGPRVGNLGFKERCEELGVKVLRIVNVNDPITKFPGFFLNENLGVLSGRYEFPWISCSCYAHVGVELVLDFFNVQNPSCVHDLDSYMINLLKCKRSSTSSSSSSSSSSVNLENDEMHFLNRAKELVLRAQDFSMVPLKNVINLIQSQRADQFLMIDENMLGLINALALYIFLSVDSTWA